MIGRFFGRLLYSVRGHDSSLVFNDPQLSSIPDTIPLTSSDFQANSPLPLKCALPGIGDNISPQLEWSSIPEGTEQLVLIMQDPDAPVPFAPTHMVLLFIPPTMTSFDSGALTIPKDGDGLAPVAGGCRFGRALMGKRGYLGPGPVPAHGPHRYFFDLFALKEKLPEEAVNWKEAQLVRTMAPLVIARGQLVGTYERE